MMERALLEAAAKEMRTARQLFERGAALLPPHVPLLQAWAVFEAKYGNR